MRMWGRYGAAGLFLIHQDDPEFRVLMQHRAAWTSQGNTWALPGGARDVWETPEEAAGREAFEETGIHPTQYAVLGSKITAGPFPADPLRPDLAGDWSYTTVLGLAPEALKVAANEESFELRWVPAGEVASLALLPAFAQAWPDLRAWATKMLG
ncbi:hypothetical protein CPPEL_01390 [Corynebacterium pseudopelargi]|uniref:Nudix hydrolase domain-containing protein n=2 Tax=Corynebacterium pseudopelargi TaxID=2080757 RepID=A0A3G6IS34_9CORY|nr:hypothetical protein CPPEL_01390 [Corynebacterium pseudopelargi]